MKYTQTVCPICGKKNNDILMFERNFSDRQLNAKVFSARRIPDKLHYRIVRCGNEGMVRSNPVLDAVSLSKLYSKSTLTYTRELEHLRQSYANVLTPLLKKLRPSDKILEIGCGNGFMLEYLRKQGFRQLVGVEPSADAIRQAAPSIKSKIKHTIFRKKLFKKGSLSAVLLFQTLDHIPQPDKFLADCSFLLKKGGYVLSLHHNVESISAQIMGEASPIIDVEHTQLFSKKTSMLLFQKVGLIVEAVSSPTSLISLRHLLWLLPVPAELKKRLLAHPNLSAILSRLTIEAKLGNVAIVGRKS
ncbi:MAG TPA: class I SAM-dependent methyltransferase [Candidatus Saccharimonadia bacterium]|nr:class I SAM-dependent methyltransferase [Candidatus Saccharimonadia bacterium]